MSQFFSSGGQNIGTSASVLPNIHGWFPLGLTSLISLQLKGLSRVFSGTTIWKHRFFGAQPSLWSNSHILTWPLEKNHLGSKITADGDCSHEIRSLALWKERHDKPRWCIEKQRHKFAYKGLYISVQFSRPVALWPKELQDARLPCPSPTLTACSNSCSSSWWHHPAISSSVVPFSSCLQSFPASGSFPMSQFFTSGSQSIGVSASASVLPMITQDWFPLELSGWIFLQSKGLARVVPNTTVQKHQFCNTQLSLWSNSHMVLPVVMYGCESTVKRDRQKQFSKSITSELGNPWCHPLSWRRLVKKQVWVGILDMLIGDTREFLI